MVETKPSILIKRIILAQMDEMRKKGLCCNCDEKWGPGHKCRNAKLFLLEGIELIHGENSGVKITKLEEEVEGEVVHKIDGSVQSNHNEDVEITLYALTGTPTHGTMRVKGRINGSRLVILIDTGSTHNFVDASLVKSLQLRIDVSKVLEVKVANGSIMKTQGFCSDVPVIVQGVGFCIHFHVLALVGCDTVLGTQWLSTLGEIQWNFKLLTMCFEYRNQQVLLQGLTPASGPYFVDCKTFFKTPVKKGLLL